MTNKTATYEFDSGNKVTIQLDLKRTARRSLAKIVGEAQKMQQDQQYDIERLTEMQEQALLVVGVTEQQLDELYGSEVSFLFQKAVEAITGDPKSYDGLKPTPHTEG